MTMNFASSVRFARSAGYRTVRLWTQSELLAARRIYARAGFACVAEEPRHGVAAKIDGDRRR